MIGNTRIRELAAEHGFKFKEQPCGEHDLNPYVFDFAYALAAEVLSDLSRQHYMTAEGCHNSQSLIREFHKGASKTSMLEADRYREKIKSNP